MLEYTIFPVTAHWDEVFMSLAKDLRQRKDCECTRSTDIGQYTLQCPHGCIYCYANPLTRRKGQAAEPSQVTEQAPVVSHQLPPQMPPAHLPAHMPQPHMPHPGYMPPGYMSPGYMPGMPAMPGMPGMPGVPVAGMPMPMMPTQHHAAPDPLVSGGLPPPPPPLPHPGASELLMHAPWMQVVKFNNTRHLLFQAHVAVIIYWLSCSGWSTDLLIPRFHTFPQQSHEDMQFDHMNCSHSLRHKSFTGRPPGWWHTLQWIQECRW